MAAPASNIRQQLYSALGKESHDVLSHNLIARKKAIEMAFLVYQADPNKINAKELSTTLLCNFATVMISYTEQSGITKVILATANSMKGSAADPSNHGEQRAWEQVQSWYSKLPKKTVIGIAIASDRAPCAESMNACSVYFGPGGNATKVSAKNPLVFTPAKDQFIYALKNFSNEALLTELLKTDFNFHAPIIKALLNDKSNHKYYAKLIEKIQAQEPDMYAKLSSFLKEAVDIPKAPAAPAAAAAATAAAITEATPAVALRDRFSQVGQQLGDLKRSLPVTPVTPATPYILHRVHITPLPPREKRVPAGLRLKSGSDEAAPAAAAASAAQHAAPAAHAAQPPSPAASPEQSGAAAGGASHQPPAHPLPKPNPSDNAPDSKAKKISPR